MRTRLKPRRLGVRSVVLATALAFIVGLAVGAPHSVGAHSAGDFYSATWDSDPDYYRGEIHSPLNTGAAKNAMRAAATYWSSVSGSWLDFNWTGEEDPDVDFTWNACTTAPDGGLWLTTAHMDYYVAYTSICRKSGTITSAAIAFDYTGRNWYTGVSSNVPSSAFDLRSVSSHEFGHATGFFPHFDPDDVDCSSADRETMCATIPVGVSYFRTLEEHDKHTVANAY